MSKTIIYPIIFCFLFLSCNTAPTVTHREGQPDIYNHSSADDEMNDAAAVAKANIHKFYEAISVEDSIIHTAAIKIRFQCNSNGESGGEHIWIGNLHFVHDSLFGTVNNDPICTTEVTLDENIFVDTNNASDWYYIENNKLVGGYTLRVDYNKTHDSDKRNLEVSLGCKIE